MPAFSLFFKAFSEFESLIQPNLNPAETISQHKKDTSGLFPRHLFKELYETKTFVMMFSSVTP